MSYYIVLNLGKGQHYSHIRLGCRIKTRRKGGRTAKPILTDSDKNEKTTETAVGNLPPGADGGWFSSVFVYLWDGTAAPNTLVSKFVSFSRIFFEISMYF